MIRNILKRDGTLPVSALVYYFQRMHREGTARIRCGGVPCSKMQSLDQQALFHVVPNQELEEFHIASRVRMPKPL